MLDASIPVILERLAVDVSRLGIIIESEDTKSVATIISPLHLIPFVNWELDEVAAVGCLEREFRGPVKAPGRSQPYFVRLQFLSLDDARRVSCLQVYMSLVAA